MKCKRPTAGVLRLSLSWYHSDRAGQVPVADIRDTRGVQRSSDVREDWLTSLPEEQDRFFESVRAQLESAYQITSIALNDVLTLREENRLPPPAEQSAIIVTLFDRLGRLLQGVLRSMGEHGRRFGTISVVIPLRPGFFRSPNAQRIARKNQIAYRVLFSAKARFCRKLRALLQIVAALQNETRYISRVDTTEIAQSWAQLEEFHYDLNTCLRETMVTFKSFLWVLPVEELAQFQIRLKSRVPPQEQFFLDGLPVSGNNS
jgi:hypothetical protein